MMCSFWRSSVEVDVLEKGYVLSNLWHFPVSRYSLCAQNIFGTKISGELDMMATLVSTE